MADNKTNLTIKRGKTFSLVLRWGVPPFVYKAITAIAQAAPARITATGHGLTTGWPCAIVSAKGMRSINAKNSPPKDSDFYPVTVIDANTVDFNDINSSDMSAYTSGGYLQFKTPVSLSGVTVNAAISATPGATPLATSSGIIGVTIDNTAKTITLRIEASNTTPLSWEYGVFEVEATDSAGTVFQLLKKKIEVEQEYAV